MSIRKRKSIPMKTKELRKKFFKIGGAI